LKFKSFREVLNKDVFEQLYVQFNKDILELSKYLNISKAIINKLINLYKIKRNEQPRFSDYPLDYYKKLFFDKNLTFDEIAELVGLRKETVRKKMTKLIPETKNLNGFSSRGEIQTDRILKELKLDYSYNKCYYLDTDDPHKKFFIDFVITFNDKVFWIEYNGKQHYQYIPYFYAESKEEWILQLKRDKIVREYSKENDITLLEIPYTCATSSEIKELIVSAIFNHDMSNIISFADFFSEETKQIYKTI
jgi:predicted transcriptional regulator